MKIINSQFILLVLFIVLSFVYFKYSFGAVDADKIFITVTTFFFSIFTGFFIALQGARYTKIREIISLDNLHLFENFIKENSACDVVDIIDVNS